MKSVRCLLILAVVSASLASAILPGVPSHSGERVASSAMQSAAMPSLSDFIDQDLSSHAPTQTENSTSRTTSGGAMQTSFTVVSPPVTDQAESGTSATVNSASGSNSVSSTAQAPSVGTTDGSCQLEQNGQSETAARTGPESEGVMTGWTLLIAAWAMVMALACGLALARVWRRNSVVGRKANC